MSGRGSRRSRRTFSGQTGDLDPGDSEPTDRIPAHPHPATSFLYGRNQRRPLARRRQVQRLTVFDQRFVLEARACLSGAELEFLSDNSMSCATTLSVRPMQRRMPRGRDASHRLPDQSAMCRRARKRALRKLQHLQAHHHEAELPRPGGRLSNRWAAEAPRENPTRSVRSRPCSATLLQTLASAPDFPVVAGGSLRGPAERD